MSMIEIRETLGLPAEEILAKRHNLWFGVSDTPWFNDRTRLLQLIFWTLEHTRQNALVCIPGRLFAVNYFHIDRMSRARALYCGFMRERQFRGIIEAELGGIPDRMLIVDYDDLLDPQFVRRRKILYHAFSEEGPFYRRVIDVAGEYLRARKRTVTTKFAEAIALYQLQELPMFLAPIRFKGEFGHMTFPAAVYPGLGPFDRLARDLVEGWEFPNLSMALRIPEVAEPCGIVSVKLAGEP
jgi:hypothetical protein